MPLSHTRSTTVLTRTQHAPTETVPDTPRTIGGQSCQESTLLLSVGLAMSMVPHCSNCCSGTKTTSLPDDNRRATKTKGNVSIDHSAVCLTLTSGRPSNDRPRTGRPHQQGRRGPDLPIGATLLDFRSPTSSCLFSHSVSAQLIDALAIEDSFLDLTAFRPNLLTLSPLKIHSLTSRKVRLKTTCSN
jgi:hypothetical protein